MTLLQSALVAGVPVFPCLRNKAPATRNGFKDATCDPDKLAVMFANVAAVMIGMPTGEDSGIVVLDVDQKENRQGMDWLNENSHRMVQTRTVRTASGGLHIYFRHPGRPVKNQNDKIAPGIDVRGDGGYVIIPPTQGYTVADDAGIADVPDWLMPALCPEDQPRPPVEPRSKLAVDRASTGHRKYALSAFDSECAAVECAAEGNRNHTLNIAAMKLGQFVGAGVLTDIMVTAGLEEAAAKCGLPSAEAKATIRSGLTKGISEPRELALEFSSWRNVHELGPQSANRISNHKDAAVLDPDVAGPKIVSIADFVRDHRAPDYLVEGILQRGYLYPITGPTGGGKTAVGSTITFCVATGAPLGSRPVEQGAVLYLVGENPDDVRGRLMVAAAVRGLDLAVLPIYIAEGPFDLAQTYATVKAQVDEIGPISLVIVDTAAAFFRGDDDNSNVQMGEYARFQLRPLTTLAGRPTVIVPAHPTKGAGRDNLVPRGGGAFLNEVDGNLSLWPNGDGIAEMHWAGKFRGPIFEPIQFALETVTHECLKDSKGRLMPTVQARALTDQEAERLKGGLRSDEDEVLDAMNEFPNGSMASWCEFLGWMRPDGEPQKSKIERRLKGLEQDRLVRRYRGRWCLTERGQEEAKKSTPRSIGRRSAEALISAAENHSQSDPPSAEDADEFNRRTHGRGTRMTATKAKKRAGRK